MIPKKTVRRREKELQAMLATPAGRQELLQLESRYQAARGRPKPGKTSLITYLLVHEWGQGLIRG
jgi:hypothetical protein